jgi:hypothetical protein
VWLRLSLLLPLLPVVYADKDPDARRNLRLQLVPLLLQLLASPVIHHIGTAPSSLHPATVAAEHLQRLAVRQDLPSTSTAAAAATSVSSAIAVHGMEPPLVRLLRLMPAQGGAVAHRDAAAAAATTAAAHEALWERLLNVLVAMLAGEFVPAWE